MSISCRFYVMATGCLSVPKEVDIEGADRFAGDVYFTSRWPHEGVDFTGKRVAVIGTGSSAVQSIPLIAEQAAALTVFQRTPAFSVPAHNGPLPPDRLAAIEADRAAYRDAAKHSRGGIPAEPLELTAAMCSEEERRARFEAAYEAGELFAILGIFADQAVNPESNEIVAEMIREKVRSIVTDAETAESLCAKDYYFGTKRPCLDTGYFETYNLPHVRLVDLRKDPIKTITETGIDTVGDSLEFDAIVYATGFDAMTGALVSVDITGRDGVALEAEVGRRSDDLPRPDDGRVPQLLRHHGPGKPVGAVEHVGVDRAARRLGRRHPRGHEVAGLRHDRAHSTGRGGLGPARQRLCRHHASPDGELLVHGCQRAGQAARVPSLHRRRRRLPHDLRRGRLRRLPRLPACGPGDAQCNDGVVRRLQPDVAMVMDMMASLDLPPLETMSPTMHVRSWRRRPRCARPAPMSAKWSTASCPARAVTCGTGCTGRLDRGRTRSSPISTAAAGCWAARSPTIRSVAISACGPER